MSLTTTLSERFDAEASSRSAALLRIGLAAIGWLQIGGHLHVGLARSVSDVLLVVAFYVAVTSMLVGYRARLATLATGLAEIAIYHRFGAEDGTFARHQSWLLAASTCCVALTSCDRSLSLDRLLVGRGVPERGRSLGLQLLRLQLSTVYFFGVVHKLNAPFLSGQRLEQIACAHLFGSDLPRWIEIVSAPLAAGVIALELALAIGLWSSRARPYLVPAGVTMHVAFAVFLPVQTFSALAVLLYIAFARPSRIHRFLAHLLPSKDGGVARGTSSSEPTKERRSIQPCRP